jgi:hypothetical protein
MYSNDFPPAHHWRQSVPRIHMDAVEAIVASQSKVGFSLRCAKMHAVSDSGSAAGQNLCRPKGVDNPGRSPQFWGEEIQLNFQPTNQVIKSAS